MVILICRDSREDFIYGWLSWDGHDSFRALSTWSLFPSYSATAYLTKDWRKRKMNLTSSSSTRVEWRLLRERRKTQGSEEKLLPSAPFVCFFICCSSSSENLDNILKDALAASALGSHWLRRTFNTKIRKRRVSLCLILCFPLLSVEGTKERTRLPVCI